MGFRGREDAPIKVFDPIKQCSSSFRESDDDVSYCGRSEFAMEMVNGHKAVNDKALALVKKLGVTPEDNATSQMIASQAATKRAELKRLSGAAFDRAYAENEVAYHSFVNAAVDTQLIPSASNGELKDLLKVGLKIFQGHQQHAEHMVEKIGRKPTASKE